MRLRLNLTELSKTTKSILSQNEWSDVIFFLTGNELEEGYSFRTRWEPNYVLQNNIFLFENKEIYILQFNYPYH